MIMKDRSFPKILLLFSICCVPVAARSQSASPAVLASAGQYFENAARSIAFTIGEVVIATQTTGGIIITQGFHQPEDYFTTWAPPTVAATPGAMALFPNPTRHEVVLLMPGIADGTTYTLFDGLGRRIAGNIVIAERTTIDLREFTNGNYLLHLADVRGVLLKTFKLTLAK